MTSEEARKSFKKVYPETFAKITRIERVKEQYIIEAMFPDGVCWFIVDDDGVSCAFDSYTSAKIAI